MPRRRPAVMSDCFIAPGQVVDDARAAFERRATRLLPLVDETWADDGLIRLSFSDGITAIDAEVISGADLVSVRATAAAPGTITVDWRPRAGSSSTGPQLTVIREDRTDFVIGRGSVRMVLATADSGPPWATDWFTV